MRERIRSSSPNYSVHALVSPALEQRRVSGPNNIRSGGTRDNVDRIIFGPVRKRDCVDRILFGPLVWRAQRRVCGPNMFGPEAWGTTHPRMTSVSLHGFGWVYLRITQIPCDACMHERQYMSGELADFRTVFLYVGSRLTPRQCTRTLLGSDFCADDTKITFRIGRKFGP